MNLYKQTLDNQVKIKDYQKGSYGTMTQAEKKFNKVDLNHFKQNKNSVQALIPGINNLQTIGSSPLKRGAKDILNSSRLNSKSFVNMPWTNSAGDLHLESSPKLRK